MHELDGRNYTEKDTESGIDWIPFDPFELVVEYTVSDIRYGDALSNNQQKGNLILFEAQLEF